jgi:DNA-directed RNA polymerase alpha subunit
MDNIQINVIYNFIKKIISIDKYEAVLDIIGIDAPIANALRRIMISEVCSISNIKVPTMAIEKVLLY